MGLLRWIFGGGEEEEPDDVGVEEEEEETEDVEVDDDSYFGYYDDDDDGYEEEVDDEEYGDASYSSSGRSSDSAKQGPKGGHRSGARKSTKGKHEAGDRRRQMDQQRGEKGDARRKQDRSGKRRRPMVSTDLREAIGRTGERIGATVDAVRDAVTGRRHGSGIKLGTQLSMGSMRSLDADDPTLASREAILQRAIDRERTPAEKAVNEASLHR